MKSPLLGPLSGDWTIEDLLDWFAEDDARLSDATLRQPLLALEEALADSPRALTPNPPASGVRASHGPAIVSLVRSIALRTRAVPALRALTLDELTSRVEGRPADTRTTTA